MDHTKLSDELRNQLLEAAAWGKAGITPVLSEATETVKQETEAAETEEVEELQEACHV